MAKKLKSTDEQNLKSNESNKKNKKKQEKNNKAVKGAKKYKLKKKALKKEQINPTSFHESDIHSVLETFNLLINTLGNLNGEPLTYNGETFNENELEVLKEIKENPNSTLLNLANQLNTTKNSIIKITNKLLHKNLIEKSKNPQSNESIVRINNNGIEVLNLEPLWNSKKAEPVVKALEKMNQTELAFFNAAIERILMNTIK